MSYQDEQRIKNYVLSGKHFEEICEKFQDDFRYVLGANWRDTLRIPPKPPILNHKTSPLLVPAEHTYWVYRLILASEGKVDNGMLTFGYQIAGIREKDMCVKFARRIETRLINAGVKDVCLVLEQRDANDVCGAIKIEALCNHRTQRLW